METFNRFYITKRFFYNRDNHDYTEEVKDKNPMQVEPEGYLEGYRFSEEKVAKDENGKETTVSYIALPNWVYLGKRVTLHELKKKLNYRNYLDIKKMVEGNNCEYACLSDNGHIFPMKPGDLTYDEMKARKALGDHDATLEMFNNLRNHLGEKLRISGWYHGKRYMDKDELIDVKDYEGVITTKSQIPFVGVRTAITNITTEDGEILYVNPFVEYRYDKTDSKDIIRTRGKQFGFGNIKIVLNNDKEKVKSKRFSPNR